jgi:cytochrome c biogenesis protein CcmG/thiol:disulfide interchange protein DsbE
MGFRPLILLPLVIFAGLGLAFYTGLENGDQPLPSMAEGKAAPPVTVTPLGAGAPPSDATLKAPGVKLVNFWASWCQPCRVEHPMLERLAAEGVTIHGINYKDKPAAAEGFLKEMGSPYATLGADSGRMALDWGVYGVPETYVIDSAGKVVLRIAGPVTEQVLERQLRPALAAAK